MTLQQLRAIHAVISNGLSVSRAATALHTTQPAVSKLVRALEKEIGLEVSARRGNRLTGLTDAGQEAAAIACRVLNDTHTLGNLGRDNGVVGTGTLRVGTTHIHARYALLKVIQRFTAAWPGVDLEFSQGAPAEILRWVSEGSVDLGISTLPEKRLEGIVALDAYPIDRCLIVPKGHALLRVKSVTIEDVARYPLVTYDDRYNSGWVVQREFQRHGLAPRIAARATDATVIKAYVAAGLGVAVLQKMAFEPTRDVDLKIVPTGPMFPSSMAAFTLRTDQFLRDYARDFIGITAPQWSRKALERALAR